MPLHVATGYPSLFIRRAAFARVGLTRAALDERLNLTADEFRVEGELVCVGPIQDEAGMEDLLVELEALGLRHFDDFFDLSGLWPPWLELYAMARRSPYAASEPNEAS
jgi:hypothetical protein